MKPLCETNKIMYSYQHGILHREHTIASGSESCDYWVYGDKVKETEQKKSTIIRPVFPLQLIHFIERTVGKENKGINR